MRWTSLLPFVVLAACSAEPGAGRPPPPPSSLSGALVVSDGTGAAGPFKLSALSRLAIDARFTGSELGLHPVRVDVLTPRGALYAQLRGALEMTSGQATFSPTLEVSGTPIEGFNQVGAWRFVLTVDDGAPLATAEVSLLE